MDLNVDHPIFLRNLMLYPLLTDQPVDYRLRSIDALLEEEKIRIDELDAPVINKVKLDNLSDHPLLLIDGEEIAGAMQNRIITSSTFIPSKTSKTLSVVCVEEGRWQQAGDFTTGYCSYPRLRSILLKKTPAGDRQQNVWNEIARKITVSRVHSITSSMNDIYRGLDDELERYLEGFSALDGKAIGFVGVAGNRILGCDLFANNQIFGQFERKLIRSYAMEARELTRPASKKPRIERFMKEIQEAVNSIQPDRKVWLRFFRSGFTGQAAFSKKVLLHLSAFPS